MEKEELHRKLVQERYRAFPSGLQLSTDQHIAMNIHAQSKQESIERLHQKEEGQTVTRAHGAGNLCSY